MSIKEILQHRHGLGLTRAQTATAVGVSTGTVSHILERASAAGLSWPLPDGLDDEALRARLYPSVARDAGCVQPDWEAVLAELGRKRKRRRTRVTRRQLWVEYRDEARAQGGTPYSYSRFCALLAERLERQGRKAQMHFDYEPGLWGLSDFSGKTLALRTGLGETDVELFVAVLAHSRMIYAEAVPDQSVRHWTMAHRRALEYFVGVPRALDHRQPQGRRRQGGPRGAPNSIRASASSRSTTTSPCCLPAREPVAPIARSNGATTRTASPHRVRQVIGPHRSCRRPTPIKYRDYRTIK